MDYTVGRQSTKMGRYYRPTVPKCAWMIGVRVFIPE